jgi:hypothetical protein
MLLPSAFSCDGGGPQLQSRAQRPKLPSFSAYQPHLSVNARPGPLSSSCRTLQAILGAPSANQQPVPHSSLQLGRALELPQQSQTRKDTQQQPVNRKANKRRRSEFEQDMSRDVLMEDCPRTPEPVRTPKRRRRIPLSMPLGLSADDFRALDAPTEEVELDMPLNSPSGRQSDDDSAYWSSPSPEDGDWTETDDRMLVETILEKFRLSRREWNDCARMLGKDRDCLERRWSLLIGEGNVGLRRGGRMSRTSLISSW